MVKRNSYEPSYAFISHVQKEAKDLALDLFMELRERDHLVWLDIKMSDPSVPAMEAGVKDCDVVIIILSPDYFNRPFCVKEREWASQYNKPIVYVTLPLWKSNIGEFCQHADKAGFPISSNVMTIDRSDPEYLELGVTKLIKAANIPMVRNNF